MRVGSRREESVRGEGSRGGEQGARGRSQHVAVGEHGESSERTGILAHTAHREHSSLTK